MTDTNSRLVRVETIVNEIKENHLPHIDSKILSIDVKINNIYIIVIITAFLAGINLTLKALGIS